MTEYAWPPSLRPSRLSFYLQHNTLRFVSPVSRATQVLRRDGARWIAEASFDPLNRTQAGVLEGLLAALAGSANTVRIWDWRREYRTGDPRSQSEVPSGPYSFSDATIFTDGTGLVVGSGTPSLAAGAARGALSLSTQGWWPNAVAVGAVWPVGSAAVCGVLPDAALSDDAVPPAPTSRRRSAKARAALETPLTVFGLARSLSAA